MPSVGKDRTGQTTGKQVAGGETSDNSRRWTGAGRGSKVRTRSERIAAEAHDCADAVCFCSHGGAVLPAVCHPDSAGRGICGHGLVAAAHPHFRGRRQSGHLRPQGRGLYRGKRGVSLHSQKGAARRFCTALHRSLKGPRTQNLQRKVSDYRSGCLASRGIGGSERRVRRIHSEASAALPGKPGCNLPAGLHPQRGRPGDGRAGKGLRRMAVFGTAPAVRGGRCEKQHIDRLQLKKRGGTGSAADYDAG